MIKPTESCRFHPNSAHQVASFGWVGCPPEGGRPLSQQSAVPWLSDGENALGKGKGQQRNKQKMDMAAVWFRPVPDLA